MKRARYPVKFKAEAVKQATQRGDGVVDAAKRLGMSDKSLSALAFVGVDLFSVSLAIKK